MLTTAELCVAGLMHSQSEREPNAIAITAPGRRPSTYRQLRDQLEKTVQTINTLGIERNDRIAIVMPNGPEMGVAFLAVAAAATAAPLNPAYRSKEFEFYLSDLNARALLTLADLDSPARGVAREYDIPIIELTPKRNGEAGLFELVGDTGFPPNTRSGFASPEDIALVLHTSGTTSRPKRVQLTHANICRSAHNIKASLEITNEDRCLSVMPLFHVHGLIGALLSSMAAGASVICAPGFSAPQFFEWMKEGQPTWYTAVPTMHQAILAHTRTTPEASPSPSLRFIRSSSSALPPPVMQKLEGVFGVPVVEAYGMTEAAHQIACNPLPPHERKAGSVGLPTGPEIAVMDEAANLVPTGETGEIVIRGANVMAGYENNPEANEKPFSNRWFKTGDEGYLDADGYLFITDRIKEVINRGGEKISPREVDEVLMDHPAVAEVVTFAVPHPDLGEDVAAAVVLKDGVSGTATELQMYASEHLADFKVPRRIAFLDEIPKGPTGKLKRIGLAELLDVPAGPDRGKRRDVEYTAPRTPIEETLAGIWAEALGVERVGIHDNFFELGGHSLQLTQILARVQEVLQVELAPHRLFETPTIAGLAGRLEGERRAVTEDRPWSFLVPLRTGGGRRPFFLVPGGGGGLPEFLIYAKLVYLLGPDQPVYGLEARGLDGQQPPHTDVEAMAADYVAEIRALQPEGPYLLGGECIGGKVAFEMARELRAQGEEVASLVLMNTALAKAGGSSASNLRLQAAYAQQFRRVEHHRQQLRALPARRWPGYVGGRLATLRRRLLPFTQRERVERHIHRMRTHYHRMVTLNRPRGPYPDRFTLLVSADDYSDDLFEEWKTWAAGGLEIHKVPGIQDSYLGEYAETTAKQLRTHLGDAQVDAR